MRKLVALTLVVAVAIALTASAKAGPSPMGVRYQHDGFLGTLSFAEAQGHLYIAEDSHGLPVGTGPIPLPLWSVPTPNCGPDKNGTILRVHILPEDILVTISDNDEDWRWLR